MWLSSLDWHLLTLSKSFYTVHCYKTMLERTVFLWNVPFISAQMCNVFDLCLDSGCCFGWYLVYRLFSSCVRVWRNEWLVNSWLWSKQTDSPALLHSVQNKQLNIYSTPRSSILLNKGTSKYLDLEVSILSPLSFFFLACLCLLS